jgi:cysteine synthase
MNNDPLHRPAIVRQVSELIGAIPLFALCRPESDARLLLKLEQFNPTGTAKTRMARQMVIDAEERGLLRTGGRIIESTSGSTGLGRAVVAAERGYTFTAVVDHHVARDKLRAMQAMGTELGSAGGVVYEVLTRMTSLAPGTTMVALINDGGEKYLDTVSDDDWMSARDLLAPDVEREVDELLAKLRRVAPEALA